MRLVDTDTVLSGLLGVPRDSIRWISYIEGVDARKTGGWMFGNKWINERFEENIKTPAPVICSYEDGDDFSYWLLSLDKNGTFSKIVFARGRGWADALLPHVLKFFEDNHGEKQVFDLNISGEPLKAAYWLRDHLHEGATTEEAVDFALKFAKIVWEKQQWQNTTKHSERPTESESAKNGTLTQTENDTDLSVM